ncbi:hypothetical protein BGX23_000424 [Mortierella sp. AD031]|nr:hypothetical protein BGX23_000424 [Mortierella sp. AD031]
MNVLGMSERHFRFKSGESLSASASQSSSLSSSSTSSSLSSKLKGKESSRLIDSLRKKSSATTTTLFSPLSPALSAGPTTTFSSTLTRSSKRSSHPLCTASCFSPLDLPSDIFVCLLEFLTPAELWKLSMASREMHSQVNGFMSRIQRFKYNAVRILYQENIGMMYNNSANAGSSPSPVQSILARIKGTSNPRSRQSYWEAQGELLVAIIMEGTPYEPTPGSRQVKEASTKSSFETGANASNTNDRFQAMVDLLFDPNIVFLNHRRAIINCARYVSASIADYFKEALSTKDPLDPTFHSAFLRRYTVRTGPYLAVFLYSDESDDDDNNNNVNDGLDHPPPPPPTQPPIQPMAPPRGVGSTLVAPPCQLQMYFQVMLWHRCMSDLIALYNRIQRLHVDVPPSLKKAKESSSLEPLEPIAQPNKAVCCQDLPNIPLSAEPTSPVMAEAYPFCCNAHSLVFTTHYPASVLIPSPIRQKFRRMAQKLQSKNLWAAVLQGHGTNIVQWEEFPMGRHVQYTGSTEKLQFCNGMARPESPATMAAAATIASGSESSSSSSHKQRRDVDDEELLQRRYRIEERIRQDTLVKQELLSLCLMACGLFMIDGQSRYVSPTLMSLLRRYGPWEKGVWREGEWRRSAIETSPWTGPEEGRFKRKKSMSPSPSLTFSTTRGGAAEGRQTDGTAKDDNTNERGPWQNLCIAVIQFLAHENLTWGGATGNEELSRLRVTINSTQWIYHE